MRKRRSSVWLASGALAAVFAFRLLFGLSSAFFSQDETQIYLLGLRYYATRQWPHFGPDVVWTRSEIPGALQGLLVGLPFRIAAIPEAPYVLLNFLSLGALAALGWYICRRLPSLPRWLVWGWLMTAPWTLEFSTHINNPSYVLPAAVLFFIGFFEAVPALGAGLVRPALAHAFMGFAVAWVMQVHMSWALLLPYAAVGWASGWRRGARSLLANAAALAGGAVVPGLLLVPTLLQYGLGAGGSPLRNVQVHAVSPAMAVTILARLFSFASLEIARFLGENTATRLAFLFRHAWLVPLAAIVWLVGIVQPLWMAREWFRRRSPYPAWAPLKALVALTVLFLYIGDWFVLERATEAHAFYVLSPIAFVFAAYCWTFVDSPAWRRVAAAALVVNVAFQAGLAWAQAPERSMYQHRDVVAAALAFKQPEMFAHRRAFAIEPGPVALHDPDRPYDARHDLVIRRSRRASGRAFTWTVTLVDTNPAVAFRDVLFETSYRFATGRIETRRTMVNEVLEPGETRTMQVVDAGVTQPLDATIGVVAAEALVPIP
jgi:hypothetical protein